MRHWPLFSFLSFFFTIAFFYKVDQFFVKHTPSSPIFTIQEVNAAPEPAATPEKTPTAPIPAAPPAEFEGEKDKATYSQTQLDLLKNLSKRREELDQREKDIQIKEQILHVTQQKIEGKLTELGELKKNVEVILAEYNEKVAMKIRSLVKIYENMKPKDAARIFEQLETDVVLQVIDGMKEAKIAPILANMNPVRAQQITFEFAKQKQLPEPDAPKDE